MRLSIIIIGDEILLGQVADTNSRAIARAFTSTGWETISVETVGDNAEAIADAVRRAMKKADAVITTGGLGPTKDDITKKVLADIFGGEFITDPEVTANIERVFRLRGLKMNTLTSLQAVVPTSCRVIQNRFGTAPVMLFEKDGHTLVSMPGVPFETEGMLPEVTAELNRLHNPDITFLHRSLMAGGITESALAERLARFEESLPECLHLAYLPVPGLIRLRLDGSSNNAAELNVLFENAFSRLIDETGEYMVYNGDATAAEIALQRLRTHGYTISTAESCTGGNIAHRITEIAGCSDVYAGSVVSYSNEVKQSLLGVSDDTLRVNGAVSEPTVTQMALGAAEALHTDCAVATSGIAGPGGATPDKPTGTVWIAAVAPDTSAGTGSKRVETRLLHLPGNRERVIDRATTDALLLLASML